MIAKVRVQKHTTISTLLIPTFMCTYICDLILTANWDPYKRKEEPNPKEQKHSLLQPASSNHVMIFFGKSVY